MKRRKSRPTGRFKGKEYWQSEGTLSKEMNIVTFTMAHPYLISTAPAEPPGKLLSPPIYRILIARR